MKKFLTVLAVVALVAFAAPAFAANPFMDVPAGHWAYDAVAQLAAKGIVSGYPDGAFKGAQPATRYEVASVVARALAKVDAEKASKQDLEMLKKLVMEFKDELDALGVKVDKIDKRVAVLEDRLGGWKLRGQFWFDAAFAGGDQGYGGSSYTGNGLDTEFRKERIRLALTKQIDENTSFYLQLRAGANAAGRIVPGFNDGRNDETFIIRNVHVDAKLPYDIDFRVGRFFVDFEDDHGLYIDNEALFGDYRVDGFQFKKTWNNFTATAVIGRNTQFDDVPTFFLGAFNGQYMNYALDLFWQPNEKFFAGISGNWFVDDETVPAAPDMGLKTYDVYASFNFTPSIALQGIYYWQQNDILGLIPGANDEPNAWKAVLDVKQDVFKFTSLRFEYAEMDNTFASWRDPYSFGEMASSTATIARNMPVNNQSTKFFFVRADQKWNDKWSTYLRYQSADFDTLGLDDAKGYGAGVTYQYTPAVAFRLAYDYVDYGNSLAAGTATGDEHVILFRTVVNF